jgi:hypothetical protein
MADLFAITASPAMSAAPTPAARTSVVICCRTCGHGKVGISEGQFRGELVMEPVVSFDPTSRRFGRAGTLGMHGDYDKSGAWHGRLYENQLRCRSATPGRFAVLDDQSHLHAAVRGARFEGEPEGQPYHYDSTRAGTPIPAVPRCRGSLLV